MKYCVFLALTALTACSMKESSWQKMKDCGAQAEKVGPDEVQAMKRANDPVFVHYVNHYSPKYDRCYVKFTSTLEVGTAYDQLFDAFENNYVALENKSSSEFCLIGEQKTPCPVVHAFIDGHMEH